MKTNDIGLAEEKRKQGFRVYEIKGIGEKIIAKKGGPTAAQVKRSNAYTNLRNNQREFGVSSHLAKKIRDSLPEDIAEIGESYVSGKLTAKIRTLAKQEEGDTGFRPILPSKHGAKLSGFEFNSKYPFRKIFKAKYLIKPSSRRGHFIFHLPAYVPDKKITFPDNATHFRLINHLLAISDFACNEKNEYQILDAENHGKNKTHYHPLKPICRVSLEPATFHLDIHSGKELKGKNAILLLLGIRFYRYEKLQYTALKEGNALQIFNVY